MPRDDLSIDFVKRMPQAEPLDPSLILDDWINRVQNFPEEIRFMQDEIAEKDRHYNECIRMIEDRDAKIQKWIKTNGSHEPNPREDLLRSQIRENYAKADRLAQEKIDLARKLQVTMDKHLRSLDIQIKLLYDRAEPGFNDPDEVPSLLRPSAANIAAPSIRTSNPSSMTVGPTLAPISTGSNPALARLPTHPHIRQAQTPQQQQPPNQPHAASAPATPAASIIINRHREGSAGPATKRGPRVAPGAGTAPTTSSGLARHSSLGPGTTKNNPATGPNGAVRAGSAGPRATTTKLGNGPGSRRGTPTAPNRKKPPHKSKLSRVKKASARTSPASTAESDLSEAESGSGDDAARRSGSAADSKDADGDEVICDVDDDDEEEEEEGGDDKKYCLCHHVSYGDMVACDNDNCPYEWFHWSCVGLKSEPNGTWYCPVCSEKLQKKAK
ncbi:PHD finger domain protein [Cordyceps fumosorosea ARSEF 2679]|uniref:Chromatin modification-related protein n=1 Tax=Cordyceps fumosorosea (strain ARSEF 2679) TaxID=1081104 RepID=A0A167WQ07_CORFA|nr:PHD finger domain protein [Cordyceps fumosorosea ARSEF 2679]OAA64067.1 PHD finger domain protein [Cordyceps fumosorosea ARSEF 2679]